MLNEHLTRDWIVPEIARVTQFSQKNSAGVWTFIDYSALVFEDLGNGTRRSKLNAISATVKAGNIDPTFFFQIGEAGSYLYVDNSGNLTILSEALAKIFK